MQTGALPADYDSPRVMEPEETAMRGLFRGLLAGYGASKLGGGCISTIVIFLLLWWLLKAIGV
jgi:hypothetical protein